MTAVAEVLKQAPKLGVVEEPPMLRLLNIAIEKNISVESIEKLVALYRAEADRMAAQEFAGAMAGFQAACPPITKRTKGEMKRNGAVLYTYQYAELDEIARTVNPLLHARGLSYTWDSAVSDDYKRLTVTCTVRHVNGHAQTASCSLPIDTAAGMSDQQKVSAATTIGMRQSVRQALGLTTTDPDADGAATESSETLSEDQVTHINDAITESGINRERFLRFLAVSSLAEIPAFNYTVALNAVQAFRRTKEKGGAQ